MAGSSGWRMSGRWRGARLPWNDGQHHMRRVALVMEDRLPRRLPPCGRGLVLARVQVAVEAREIAGGDLEAMRWPGRKTWLVAQRSMVKRATSPGMSGVG